MAFYFALFNVSNVNQELKGRNRAHKRERRRHSLATSSSAHVAKDYRLLPKPKIIFHDPNNTDNETVSTLVDESGDDETSGHHSIKLLEAKDSLKYRRASSPDGREKMDLSLNDALLLNSMEERLKRARINSTRQEQANRPSSSNSNRAGTSASDGPTGSKWTSNQDDEQIWVRQSPSQQQQHASAVIDDPWVYSIELEKRTKNDKLNRRPPLPEKHRPAMGISALELRSADVRQNERNQLRDDLRRHINTWPEIRASRTHWRPSLLLRRHSGGSLTDNERLIQFFQRRRGSGDRPKSQIPYQAITPTSPPQDPSPNGTDRSLLGRSSDLEEMNMELLNRSQGPSGLDRSLSGRSLDPARMNRQLHTKPKELTKSLPPKPSSKPLVIIMPTSRQPSGSNQFRSNLNSWAQQAIKRTTYRDVPFVRLQNEPFEQSPMEGQKGGMIRSSVF